MRTTHIYHSFLLLLIAVTLNAQQGINYKAIINDSNGYALANTEVTVEFTILENGTIEVYKESHTPTTDANGIIIVNIGEGTVLSGDFSTIDWGSNPHFLKAEIDSGDGLTDMGTTEFKAVPYALHSKDAASEAYVDGLELRIIELELKVTDLIGFVNDSDGDGYLFYQSDCNDTVPTIYPGATEYCDGLDNDCDNLIDEECISLINLDELEIQLNMSYENFSLDEIINTDSDLFDYFEDHLNCVSMEPDDYWPVTGWFSKRTNCSIIDCGFWQSTNYDTGFGVRKNAELEMENVTVTSIQENSGTDFSFDLGISPNGQSDCLNIPIALYFDFSNECLGDINIRVYGNVTINTINIDIRVSINFVEQSISLISSEVSFTSINFLYDTTDPIIEEQASSVDHYLYLFITNYFEVIVVSELFSEIEETIANNYFN